MGWQRRQTLSGLLPVICNDSRQCGSHRSLAEQQNCGGLSGTLLSRGQESTLG